MLNSPLSPIGDFEDLFGCDEDDFLKQQKNELIKDCDIDDLAILNGSFFFDSEFSKEEPIQIKIPEKKKRRYIKPDPQIVDPGRKWFCSFFDVGILGAEIFQFSVGMKSRLENKIYLVPERLYSSIKYQFFLDLKMEKRKKNHDFLFAKIEVIDSNSNLPIANGIDGNDFVKISHQPHLENGKLVGKCRAQFKKELNSHKSAKEYVYRISFFLQNSNEGVGKHCISLQSPPFKVYSRRKRKRNEDSSPRKKHKISKKEGNNLDSFKSKLGELLKLKSNLSKKEQQECQELLKNAILSNHSIQ